MKKLFVSLLLSLAAICSSTQALAAGATARQGFAETARGKAYMAAYYSCSGCLSTIFMANITDNPVDITITYYTANGTILKDSGGNYMWGYNISNYNDNPAGNSSVTGTIAARNSAYIDLTNANAYGYAVIEWTQSGTTVPYALVAHGKYQASNSYFAIPINEGKPF